MDRWRAVEGVDDEQFWEVAQDAKSRMLQGVRERLTREYRRKGLNSVQLRHITKLLDPANPNVLTIGFARRFATYKRAALIMRDRARLLRLVSNPERPILFLFAGKAHPADYPGQQVLREIKQLMLTPEFAGRVVFLEDYDIQLARWLVTGVDVWLNNPIAPLEASGTSGIKAAVNGRLNLSILDGWWAEAFDGENGWGIPGADVQDTARRDELDSATILDALEEDVMPLYYARDARGLSPGMGEALQARDGKRRAAFQHAPRGARLRRGHVPAGGVAGRAAVGRQRSRCRGARRVEAQGSRCLGGRANTEPVGGAARSGCGLAASGSGSQWTCTDFQPVTCASNSMRTVICRRRSSSRLRSVPSAMACRRDNGVRSSCRLPSRAPTELRSMSSLRCRREPASIRPRSVSIRGTGCSPIRWRWG